MKFRIEIIEADGATHPGADLYDSLDEALAVVTDMINAVDSSGEPVWTDEIRINPVMTRGAN